MFFIYLKVLLPGQLHLSCIFLCFPLSKLRPVVGYDGQPSRHLAKIFYFFLNSLPSANPEGTRQRAFIFFWKFSLPSANPPGTRQRSFLKKKFSLPSANPWGTWQRGFIFFWKFSLPSAKPPGTRQRFFIFFKKIICRASTRKALGKELLFFFGNFLCRVPPLQALGKDFFLKLFAECQHGRHSAKFKFFF